jgi:hypothetical protein
LINLIVPRGRPGGTAREGFCLFLRAGLYRGSRGF